MKRRLLVKGAAWSAPAVLTSISTPVFAASKDYRYRLQLSSQVFYSGTNTSRSSSNIYFTVRTDTPVSPNLAGLTITYNGNEGVDTVATMNKLQYIVALPKGYASTFSIKNNSPWVFDGKSNPAQIQLGSGSSVSATNFDIFTFTYTGQTRNNVVESTYKESWPGTLFSADSTVTSIPRTTPTSMSIYTGYIVSYETDNGFVRNNVTNTRQIVLTRS